MNGVLVVDKPVGPTSHDVVAVARRALGTRAVGHAGTLDPLASGVLVVAVGEGTKLVQYLTADDKEYETEVRLGQSTSTGDAAGDVLREAPVPAGLDARAVERALEAFLGTHPQPVPRVSAVKVGGERLHQKARRGEAFEVPSRDVTLHAAELVSMAGDTLTLRLRVSKGFYVRSFGEALGRALGTEAHLAQLRRTRSGVFGLERAAAWDLLLRAKAGDGEARAELRARLLPVSEAWGDRPRVTLGETALRDAKAGRRVAVAPPDGADPGAVVGGFTGAGHLVALLSRDPEAGTYRVVRGIHGEPGLAEGQGAPGDSAGGDGEGDGESAASIGADDGSPTRLS